MVGAVAMVSRRQHKSFRCTADVANRIGQHRSERFCRRYERRCVTEKINVAITQLGSPKHWIDRKLTASESSSVKVPPLDASPGKFTRIKNTGGIPPRSINHQKWCFFQPPLVQKVQLVLSRVCSGSSFETMGSTITPLFPR